MDGSSSTDRTTVDWQLLSPDEVTPPIVRRRPYLELKLEHPALEPSGIGDRLFPDAVPYELDAVPRVFYWRPSLAHATGPARNWELLCATTHELLGIDSLPADVPPLVTQGASSMSLVVNGTIAGDAMTSHVRSYSVPNISVDSCSTSRIELTIEGTEYGISAGERRRIHLSEQSVEPATGESESQMVTPILAVRYPGQRELHHPAREATYRLFPSFGLDIEEIPNPLPIPTAASSLDETALAKDLNLDLSQRPYPERVLWQALTHTGFGPHTETMPELTQLESGHIVLQAGDFSGV